MERCYTHSAAFISVVMLAHVDVHASYMPQSCCESSIKPLCLMRLNNPIIGEVAQHYNTRS